MPSTHTADFQTAALKATDLEAVEKINVGLETELARKQLNIIADAPEIRIQDKTGSASETTMSIVADGGATHFRAGIDTFAEGTETKGNVKFQSSTGATTHAEIVGSSGTLELQDGGLALKLGSNVSVTGTSKVIQEITGPHARDVVPLRKYPEVPLASNVQSGYVVSTSSDYTNSTYLGSYKVFNETLTDYADVWIAGWNGSSATASFSTSTGAWYQYQSNGAKLSASSGTPDGEWLSIKLPKSIKLDRVEIASRNNSDWEAQYPKDFEFWGTVDGTTWSLIKQFSGASASSQASYHSYAINSAVYYNEIAFIITKIPGETSVGANDGMGHVVIGELKLYGYEEVGAGDDSVDTTVKSVYNAPDLTSAALYIDATKPDSNESVTDQSGSGVTVTAVGVTHDSTENAWELTGAATSNIVSGNLASLVGDHPHSVSAWVKADVLNGDGLFHLGTAEGEGDAASRVGFVDDSHISWGGEDHFFSNAEWHNVTYTYNGEGSDKKLYLDGRRVGTAKNEDTFGEYPPFAMSTYSQYGYTVSASSELAGGGYKAWEAFDNTTGGTSGGGGAADQAWISANLTYQGNTYNSTKNLGTDHGGSATASGEYLILELPHKLRLSYVAISPRGSETTHAPRDGKVYGSNDRVNWTEIGSFTGLEHSTGKYASVTVNATTGFKMFAVVTTAILFSNAAAWLGIGELKYYGHRENDLVRFPDSVNVLKYPHMAMAAPVHRGYAATASSYRTVGPGDYRPHKAFNKVFNAGSNQGWNNQNTLTEYNGTDYLYNGSINLGTGAQNGEWIKLELPRKILMTSMTLYSRDNDPTRAPEDFIVYGSNNDSNWSELLSEVGATPADTGTTYTADTATTYYKYFALVVRRITGQNNYFSIDNIEYIGTEEDLDVVARVGDGFDGKIRNLRVFSTALSDARVQEIFDADKDEFGLAKSSVSVHRGHLGVGTTEPKGALTVMDEVAELGEFPPRAMSGYETYMEGHGNFKVSASSEYNSITPAINAFNKVTTFGTYPWISSGSPDTFSTSTGLASSADSFEGTNGPWIKLALPYNVKPQSVRLYTRNTAESTSARKPKSGNVYGYKGGMYHKITDFDFGSTYKDSLMEELQFNTDEYYSEFVLQITSMYLTGSARDAIAIKGINYFGTREQGASTLHNGELSLTRNLTVPRIGPPLDADDTPMRDRLVVEYNTSTNPTENGVVKDTSGRGNDGSFYGNTSYDATEKALVFDGTDDYIKVDDTGIRGDYIHSVSFWIYNDNYNINPFWIGENIDGKRINVYITASQIDYSFRGDTVNATSVPPINRWWHLTLTYNGTQGINGRKIYIDGVEQTTTHSGTATALNIVDGVMYLGTNFQQASDLNGKMSNFKLYDTALTADEVKRLYDMGRLGNVIAQPVHIAAPLYAPGTIVQVESSTKSDTFSATGLNTHPLSPGNDVPGLSVTIHPKFANSKILISYDVNMGSLGRAYLRIQRTQGGNVTAIEAPIGPAGSTTEGKSTSSTAFGSNNSEVCAASFTHYDDANSTVPITYQIQAWTYHTTYYVYINRAHQDHDGTTNNSTYWARTLSSITAKEVCQ